MKKQKILAVTVLTASALMLSGVPSEVREPKSIPAPEPTVEIINRIDWWNEHPEDDPRPLLGDAYAAAKVADAVCPDGSVEVKSAIMQCVYNRSLAVGFPDTMEAVADQPYQWVGSTIDAQPSDETRALARELITQWRNGEGYVIYLDCVYMVKEADGLYFRSTWDGSTERIVPYER